MKQITCRFDGNSWPFWIHDDGDYLSRKLQSKTHGGPGSWEPAHSKAVLDHLEPGDVALDLGANMGWYTHLMSQAVGSQGRVISLEPNQENFQVLEANKQTLDWNNVTLVPQAAGDCQRTVWLSQPLSVNHGDSRVYHPGDSHQISYEVLMTDIDSLLLELGIPYESIKFIKMDCQGAEPMILQGMQRTENAMLPSSAMLMEIWPESWNQQPHIDVDTVFFGYDQRWRITDDDMRTSVSWSDFLMRVRRHFFSTRHVLRGWDVLLTRV